MRIRVRFEKMGPIRYVGHLDFMRTFQKIVKKSGLAAVYTGGFNPHMVLSFADPLGVGQESSGEYADIEFAYKDAAELTEQELYRLKDIGLDNETLPEPPSSEELVAALNAASPEGVRFTGAVRVGLIKSSKVMALVRYASWEMRTADSAGVTGFDLQSLGTLTEEFLARESIIVHKVTKKSEKDVDIRPQILSLSMTGECLKLTCESGSNGNLKPQTVLEALCQYAGCAYDEYAFRLIRTELFDGKMRPLLNAGTAF